MARRRTDLVSRPCRIRQPGPPAAERIVAVEGRGRGLRLRLAAGSLLLTAVAEALAAAGFPGGAVVLDGLALGPFAYVMPALSQTPDHAAYYSETFRPAGVTRIERGAMTVGLRDGAPFFHAHALWREADGRRSGGHILPLETRLAESAEIEAYGFAGGVFTAVPDAETGFTLFEPAAGARPGPEVDTEVAWALRLRPNQDLAGALEAFCVARGLGAARLHGGVGSTIGAQFEDGTLVERFATEVFLAGARLEAASRGPLALLDAGLVDFGGDLAEGRLVRGQNPVLMTFEVIVGPA
ncbi:MAG: DUF296 domain-containing protein [Alsobacter sp.]